jgi:hypothetical protein
MSADHHPAKTKTTEHFSRLRRIALKLWKLQKNKKVGINSKQKLCACDNDDLLKVIAG